MSTFTKVKIPGDGDERAQLNAFLDRQRALVRMKCIGLSDADSHRQLLFTSPLTTVAALVAHLRWVEYSWFNLDLEGVPDEGQTPWKEGGHPDAEMLVEGRSLAELLDEYDAECERSRRIAERHELTDLEARPSVKKPVSLRYILLHMIEETARHLGHLDLLREMLDGARGYTEPGEHN
jgi:uncharacterized damage-inducible protein DinB